MVDFVKDGQVGDAVYERAYGNGLIQSIGSVSGFLPISVRFKGVTLRFSTRGELVSSLVPTLCWGHRVEEKLNQGQPPERFEYPIYKKHVDDGELVKFTSLGVREILVKGRLTPYVVGTIVENSLPHTNPKWLDCEKPEPTPLQFEGTPKWAMVSDTTYAESVKLLVLAKLKENFTYPWIAVETDTDVTEISGLAGWANAWEIEDE